MRAGTAGHVEHPWSGGQFAESEGGEPEGGEPEGAEPGAALAGAAGGPPGEQVERVVQEGPLLETPVVDQRVLPHGLDDGEVRVTGEQQTEAVERFGLAHLHCRVRPALPEPHRRGRRQRRRAGEGRHAQLARRFAVCGGAQVRLRALPQPCIPSAFRSSARATPSAAPAALAVRAACRPTPCRAGALAGIRRTASDPPEAAAVTVPYSETALSTVSRRRSLR